MLKQLAILTYASCLVCASTICRTTEQLTLDILRLDTAEAITNGNSQQLRSTLLRLNQSNLLTEELVGRCRDYAEQNCSSLRKQITVKQIGYVKTLISVILSSGVAIINILNDNAAPLISLPTPVIIRRGLLSVSATGATQVTLPSNEVAYLENFPIQIISGNNPPVSQLMKKLSVKSCIYTTIAGFCVLSLRNKISELYALKKRVADAQECLNALKLFCPTEETTATEEKIA